MQQNEVVLYFEGKYMWVGVNGFFQAVVFECYLNDI